MLKNLRTFVSSLAEGVVVSLIVALIPITVLISFLTGTLDVLVEFMNSEVPVWLLTLCVVSVTAYIRSMAVRIQHPIQASPEKFLIEDNGLKWRVVDHKNGASSVDQVPLCPVHGYEYVQTNAGQYICREVISSKCDSKIVNADDHQMLWKMAKSKAQNIVSQCETRR